MSSFLRCTASPHGRSHHRRLPLIPVTDVELIRVWFYFYGGGSQLNVLVWTGVIAEAFTKWDRALDLTCRESQVSPQQVLQKSLSRRSTMGRPASLPPCYEAVVGLTPPLQTPSPSTSSPTSRIGPNIAPTRRRMDVLAEYHEGSDTFGPPTATAPPPAASRQRFEAVSPFQEVARTRMQTILPEVVPRTPTPGRGSGFFSNLLRNIGNLMGGLSSSGGHTPDIDISSEFDFLRPTPFETGHSSSPLLGSHAQRLEKLAMPKYWREALSPVLQASGGVRRFKPKQSDVRFQYLADDGSGDQLSVGFSLSDIVLTEGGKRTLVKGNGVDLATTVASHCEGYINAR